MGASSTLPTEPAERKTYPIATGVLDYFPDAIAAVSHVSYVGNEQHNAGEPLHWAREKSTDQEDTMLRHFLERGTLDKDGLRHTAKMVWRGLAILQLEIENERRKFSGEPGAVIYYNPTPTGNSPNVVVAPENEVRASGGQPVCQARGEWFFCERVAGHSGDHMAWKHYGDTRELYKGGRWPQQPTPLQNCPRPGGAF